MSDWASPVSLDPSIVMPGSQLEIFQVNHACRAAQRMNQARNRTALTLLMHAAFKLYIKMATPGWPRSCNTGIKVTSSRASQPDKPGKPGSCNQAVIHAMVKGMAQIDL